MCVRIVERSRKRLRIGRQFVERHVPLGMEIGCVWRAAGVDAEVGLSR